MSGCEVSSCDNNTTGSRSVASSSSSLTNVCGKDKILLIEEFMLINLRGRIVYTLNGLEMPPTPKAIS